MTAQVAIAEKYCAMCDEYWPADTEFFFKKEANSDGLSRYCKACYAEMPSGRRKAASRARPPRLCSPWESLFPEYAEAKNKKKRKPVGRVGARA